MKNVFFIEDMTSENKHLQVLAIIPARGGSRGVPGKNVKYLCGKPLITWIIEAALKSRFINRLVVSTDDSIIADVSIRSGAEVVRRPMELAGDTASSETALLHAIDYLNQKDGYCPNLIVFLQCTSPLTNTDDIDGTIERLISDSADTALSVSKFHYFLWKEDKNGASAINDDKSIRQLRQEREPQFIETGSVYVMRAQGFKEAKHRFFGKTVLYEIPDEHCWEIDENLDFTIAEIMLRQQLLSSWRKLLPSSIQALVLDFDGVLTDNRVLVSEEGHESVVCDRGDGWGLARLRETGISIIVLSTESNSVVAARCEKLHIKYRQALDNKVAALDVWLRETNIDRNDVVYVGNDVNDLECMKIVGCAIAVADAHPDLKPYAKIILNKKGGSGAVRELCDLLLVHMQNSSTDKHQEVL